MSSNVLPNLVGLGFDVTRAPVWNTAVTEAMSGMETAVSFVSYPRWLYGITYDILRSDSNLEWQDLNAFFNTVRGKWDSFLYNDPDDNAVTAQSIGTGDGSTLAFQLLRTMTGAHYSFIEPILAPNVVTGVYVNGVSAAGNFTVSNWGNLTPGVVTFNAGHAPAAGAAVTATFSYYFPCRFQDDTLTFNKFMNQMWGCKTVNFKTLKNGS